jgi:purine-binding chemotaxis protein CheW
MPAAKGVPAAPTTAAPSEPATVSASGPSPGFDDDDAEAAGPRLPPFPGATPSEAAVFAARARALRERKESSEPDRSRHLSVVRLGEELFGVDADLVREFAPVRGLTPIPCCPPHVLGDINLRGDLVTLVDLRAPLQLPAATSAPVQAMVVQVGELVAAIAVDEVLDLVPLRHADLRPAPDAARAGAADHLQGIAPYKGRMLSVLDLAVWLLQGDLTVDDEP